MHTNSQPSTVCRNREVEESIEQKVEEQSELTSSLNMGSKRMVNAIIRTGRRTSFVNNSLMSAVRSKPSLLHAIVVIFLEFFAWGLLTLPAITVLNTTFPDQTFLMNGLIMGVKGFLSFLSAPLIGALSDLWGRKFFLLITVFFTCLPIPFMKFSPSIYFGLVILSGIFSVTFSVIFAYVADITEEHERSHAYGWLTASFSLSLISSPSLGALISSTFGDDNLVICIATGVAIFDLIYILLMVPESLPEKLRQKSISIWESADPFSSIRRAGKDRMILTLCVAVFLSYLPEAGQYSCFFVYLKLVIGFDQIQVAAYIAFIGILSVISQTLLLTILMKRVGSKNTIMIGLIFEMLQLICFGLGSSHWVVWIVSVIAAISTITYPALSAYVSSYADADKQGLLQGIITGIRGLSNGLGPCFFGLIFSLFNVDLVRQSHPIHSSSSASVLSSSAESLDTLKHMMPSITNVNGSSSSFITFLNSTTNQFFHSPTDQVIPGPPFLFGSFLVLIAILIMAFMPELVQYSPSPSNAGSYDEKYSKGSSGSYKSSVKRSPTSTNSHNYYYKNMHHTQANTYNSNQCCSINNDEYDDEEEDELNVPMFNAHHLSKEGGQLLPASMLLNGDLIHHNGLYTQAIACPLSSSSSTITYNLSMSTSQQQHDHSLSPFQPSSSSSSYGPSSEADSDIDSKQRLLPISSANQMVHNDQLDGEVVHHRIGNHQREQFPNVMHTRHNTIVRMSPTPNHPTTTAIHWPHSLYGHSGKGSTTKYSMICPASTMTMKTEGPLTVMKSPIHRPLNLSKSINMPVKPPISSSAMTSSLSALASNCSDSTITHSIEHSPLPSPHTHHLVKNNRFLYTKSPIVKT
ncbi:hippocampus abundant transcript 1 protein-like isoform x1 [Dermatophagoides farinae]|uniref:Hippocampus abundant transcript 1 protein-like isoform x1 n=1 Tax=Dermatophagoides farinae TaxID=6954 RepID=A0A9D4SL73_DERFA|nr:hippocampus abundant transcript 1 protein-like [Dermatophagoides farinae]XP_046912340.1 hippocampus abundant transcript 1 protein-like [Dermatophagoides farinae]KAH7645983.1 hippocampus abundant transcript 1 protein-like isoform x1 [Dermatophagoides farinae]